MAIKIVAVSLLLAAHPVRAQVREPQSPLPGGRLLSDEMCLTPSTAGPERWALRQASREFLIAKGLRASYFDEHFCVLNASFQHYDNYPNPGSTWAYVTYKVTFPPYLSWWQHHFPVVAGEDKRLQLRNGAAVVDISGKVALMPEIEMSEIRPRLRPKELERRMRALIGALVGPLQVGVGPVDMPSAPRRPKVRLYVYAMNKNPKPDSCSNTDRIGTIDVDTGESVVTYSGACPAS